MIVVSNTGPLIALAKANQLVLLKQLFGQVLIPPAVHRELLAKSGPESARLDKALMGSIKVTVALVLTRGQNRHAAAGCWRTVCHRISLRAQGITISGNGPLPGRIPMA